MLEQPFERVKESGQTSFDQMRVATFLLIIGLASVVFLAPLALGTRSVDGLTMLGASRHELPLLPVFLITLVFRPKAGNPRFEISRHAGLALLAAAVAFLVIAGWAGHYLVFQGLNLSRDEQMAVFDQQIFARGQFLWPIPLDWRPMADALGRRFILPIGANEFWVSGYLPIHAASRALFGFAVDPALTSPFFAALAAVCTWQIGRKLWPGSSIASVVVLILLISSSQVIITSMTTFSMSMHLGLNLLWLLLFLKDKWWTHALAMLVAFFATGIHQPLFHPLFALPFLTLLVLQRRWQISAAYLAAYAAIGLFWLWWPLWIASHGTGPAIAIDCANSVCTSGVSFIDRLLATFGTIGIGNFWMTAANLLRFILWQHPLLAPLALLGAVSLWRSEPLVKALVASFILPIIVMAILLPWQGWGWGYRYVHPVLGNAILLAGYGFHWLQRSGLSIRKPFAISTVIAVILLGVHASMVRQIVKPFVQVRDELSAIPADVVIVDTDRVPFGQDVVINRFDLTNRPTLLIAALLKPADLPALCARSTVTFFDAPRLAPLAELFGAPPPAEPSGKASILRKAALDAGCRIR